MPTSNNLALAAAIAVAAVAAAPANAAYKLLQAGIPVAVAKSTLTITPGRAWNRGGPRPGRNAESWTQDGYSLNDVTYYGGIADNATLFREVDKKNAPLPRFNKTMLLPDIPQLFEQSYRIALGTPLFTIGTVEQAQFAGQTGFRFTYDFVDKSDEVRRKGEARGAVVNGKLYMMTYEAPEIFFFDRNHADFEQLVAGAAVK
jgi:hypothetical protein